MAKKAFPDKDLLKLKNDPDFKSLSEPAEGGGGEFKAKVRGKVSAFSSKAFAVIKFILGLAILPFVYSNTLSFLQQFGLIEKGLQQIFYNGIISFLAIYLFIWEPEPIYSKGHKILELIFNFFKPLLKVAPFLLPIYTILVFALYGLFSLGISEPWLIQYAMFLAGFTLILHLVFSARNIRHKKGDFLKGNYIFGFSFIYILNLALVAFGFSLIFKVFSFVDFCNISYAITKNIYAAIFKQFFLV